MEFRTYLCQVLGTQKAVMYPGLIPLYWLYPHPSFVKRFAAYLRQYLGGNPRSIGGEWEKVHCLEVKTFGTVDSGSKELGLGSYRG